MCALDLPAGRSFAFRPDPPLDHQQWKRRHETHRSAGTDQVTGDGVGRGRLRAPRRVHPAGLRPAAGVADPPHPRAPRAGRRAHGRGLRPRHRASRRGAGDVGPGGDEPRDAADGRLHGLDPDGGDHRAGADEGDRQRRLPGVRHRRHHPLGDEAQRAGDDARGAADGDPPGVPHRHHRPARPGARRRAQGRAAGADGVGLAVRRRRRRLAARLPPDGQGSRPDDPRGGPADPRVDPPGALRRRRHPQGARRRRAARARRADRHPRRHDADGPWRVPRRPPARARHARDARQRHRRDGDAAQRPADRPRRPLRRPRHRPARRLRPRGQDHPRRRRPGRAGQGAPARRARSSATAAP